MEGQLETTSKGIQEVLDSKWVWCDITKRYVFPKKKQNNKVSQFYDVVYVYRIVQDMSFELIHFFSTKTTKTKTSINKY